MKYLFLLILIISCCPEIHFRYMWYCDNHREYIGEHNFGKGHLCDTEECRRYMSEEHDCVGWRVVRFETN